MNERSFTVTFITPMDNKRELILKATEKVIATKGLAGLSMQQVATEAGVAAGTIYRYFKDKDELITELRKDLLIAVAEHILKGCDQGTLEQKFKRIWFNIIDFGRQRTAANLSYEQYTHLTCVHSDTNQSFEKSTFKELHFIFEEGKTNGLFHPLDDKALFAISLEPAVALGRHIRRGMLEYNKTELDLACDLCWKAILIPSHTTTKEQSGR